MLVSLLITNKACSDSVKRSQRPFNGAAQKLSLPGQYSHYLPLLPTSNALFNHHLAYISPSPLLHNNLAETERAERNGKTK